MNCNQNFSCDPKTRNLSKSKYERPDKTYSDSLQTNDKMREKLQGYIQVNDIGYVAINTHVRYVTWRDGNQRFCLGGLLKEKHDKYVKLSNGKFHWSVQKEHFDDEGEFLFKTVFFRILSPQERADKVQLAQQDEIEEKDDEITRLRAEVARLRL